MGRDDIWSSEITAGFWPAVARASRRLLMLDYDGTLAPFRAGRMDARPAPGLLDALLGLAADGTRIAIVSGRPVAELRELLGEAPGEAVGELVGEHGWEFLGCDGRVRQHALAADVRERLARAERLAWDAGWSEWLERKRTACVLHTRALDPAAARAVTDRARTLWAPVRDEGGLALDATNGGLELRATDHHKGTAVRELLAQEPPDVVAVFIGDDVTDEDGFAALAGGGFGIRIGAPDAPTRATGRLPSAEALVPFLEHWQHVTAPGAEPGRPSP